MKLITEFLANTTEVSNEVDEATGAKHLYIEGVFMQAEVQNKNGRIYPMGVLEGATNKYIQEAVATSTAIGELNHPQNPIPDPAEASHLITHLVKEGNDFIGKARILNTPKGNVVKGLLEGGVKLGVSSRGLGTVKQKGGVNEVQNGYVLKTVDVVSNPSAPNAFVNGIMEGVEYLVDGSTISEEDVARIEDTINKTPASQLQEVKVRLFLEAMQKMNITK